MNEKNFLETLLELQKLFKKANVIYWADFIEGFLTDKLDCNDLKKIKSRISGMGNMNDVYLSKRNGFNVEVGEEKEMNNLLLKLTAKLYNQTVSLMKEENCE